MKDLDGLNAAYASMQESGPMLLTKADKVGKTPAWRNRHKKNVQSGEPLYKMADHLKDEYESELWNSVAENLTELHNLSEQGTKWKVSPLSEKESYKTVAAVIDYDRSKKGTDDATYDSEHGEKKKAKKERDYAAWERSKMKRDDPDWKHKKGSTSESLDVNDASLKGVTKKEVKNLQKAAVTGKGKYVKKADQLQDDKKWGYDKKGNSLNPVDIMKKKRKDDDLAGAPNKVKEELEKTGLFSPEELENLA